jgi:hypothetical protein
VELHGIDFAGLLGAVDGSSRPLFAAAAPQNAQRSNYSGSTNGTVAGLDLVVDPNYTGDDIRTLSTLWFIHQQPCDSMSQAQFSYDQTLLLMVV